MVITFREAKISLRVADQLKITLIEYLCNIFNTISEDNSPGPDK